MGTDVYCHRSFGCGAIGVGTATCGPGVLPPYRAPVEKHAFGFMVRPLKWNIVGKLFLCPEREGCTISCTGKTYYK